MDNAELLTRVRELRAQGRSPKEIARALGVSPSTVAPLVRAIAAEGDGGGRAGEVFGCWVNTGWSVGLGVDATRGWTDEAPGAQDTAGMVSVLVARRHGWDKVSICGYLVDVYCLGVKNVLGPDVMDEVSLRKTREFFFSDYAGWQEVPLELARHLVFGGVEYARGLGFEPHEDFPQVSGHLGDQPAPPITFGREGRPFYMAGPRDDARKVIRTLERAVGSDGFDAFVGARPTI
ncbi:helix-turn-helix domain-containing protein [Nonomuraea sp. NPDC046570]|uniref:helix-turn-helix domain-containing protein n=1 Tax=Nonomuraea sp. NPDC046570 TaxID=3155255 RepID=UPI0034078D21